MNKYMPSVRKRRRTLLIVEGDHEKNILFKALFHAFPEMGINYEDVWIYGTNIYILYNDIVKEYGADWANTGDDIDLPLVISKKKTPDQLSYKEDFTDIFLVFDYERHDPGFSEDKIAELQNYFQDSTDMGKLFINYPMVESYQHLQSLPDPFYENRFERVIAGNGNDYKKKVYEVSVIRELFWFPHKIDGILEDRFFVSDADKRKDCVNSLLQIHDNHNLFEEVLSIVKNVVRCRDEKTFTYQFIHEVNGLGYLNDCHTYWEHMRWIFKSIIYHNVCKASKIQYGKYVLSEGYKEVYFSLRLLDILEEQNKVSRADSLGIIWVLNTCVFLVADYKFSLVEYPGEAEA